MYFTRAGLRVNMSFCLDNSGSSELFARPEAEAHDTVKTRCYEVLQSYYVWKMPLEVPSAFKSGLLQFWKKCATDCPGGDGEVRVLRFPTEAAPDAHSVPPWGVPQGSGDPCLPSLSSQHCTSSLWLLADRGGLDPEGLVLGASSGSA